MTINKVLIREIRSHLYLSFDITDNEIIDFINDMDINEFTRYTDLSDKWEYWTKR